MMNTENLIVTIVQELFNGVRLFFNSNMLVGLLVIVLCISMVNSLVKGKFFAWKKKTFRLFAETMLAVAIILGCKVYFVDHETLGYAIIYGALLLCATFSIPLAFLLLGHWRTKKRYERSGMEEADMMDGHEFEEFLAVKFKRLGYICKLTGLNGHDYGVDLVLEKDNESIVLQAKRYNGKVGIKAVQEIIAGKEYYGADRAMVVTNSYYTQSAINLAERCGVELWDREDCIAKFQ